MAEIPALDDSVVLWSAETAERTGRPLLLLLHGYGADERDLFGLVPYLPSEFVVAGVRAPLSPPFPAPGYSWYPIEGLDGRDARHVTDAASRLLGWVDAVAPEAVVGLLGFSQGAAVALQAMRLRPARFAFAVNLSGYATPGELPGDSALARAATPRVLGQGHARRRHPALPRRALDAWLPEHVDLSGRVYQGLTHSVSEQELEDVGVFLKKQLDELAVRIRPLRTDRMPAATASAILGRSCSLA